MAESNATILERWKTIRDNLTAAMADVSTPPVASYSVGGVMVRRENAVETLMYAERMIDKYQGLTDAETYDSRSVCADFSNEPQ